MVFSFAYACLSFKILNLLWKLFHVGKQSITGRLCSWRIQPLKTISVLTIFVRTVKGVCVLRRQHTPAIDRATITCPRADGTSSAVHRLYKCTTVRVDDSTHRRLQSSPGRLRYFRCSPTPAEYVFVSSRSFLLQPINANNIANDGTCHPANRVLCRKTRFCIRAFSGQCIFTFLPCFYLGHLCRRPK